MWVKQSVNWRVKDTKYHPTFSIDFPLFYSICSVTSALETEGNIKLLPRGSYFIIRGTIFASLFDVTRTVCTGPSHNYNWSNVNEK